jgi:hypothetical protein
MREMTELEWLRRGVDRRSFGAGISAAALSLALPARAGTKPADSTPMVRARLEKLHAGGGGTLALPRGEYHFWPDAVLARHLYISNNDPGENRIIFPIEDFRELTVDGNGSRFVFHGLVTPFAILKSSRVTLRNLEIDWQVPFHCEGDVLAADPDGRWIEVRIPEPFSYRVDAENRFYIVGEGFERQGMGNILEFNRERHETEYQVADNFFLTRDGTYVREYKARETGPRRVRFEVPNQFRDTPGVGGRVAIMPRPRRAPAVFIADSEDVQLERVAIRHAGCMGVIAQLSRNISLKDCEVRPRPDSGRYISTCFDATHFVNCAGLVSLDGCATSNHHDDGLNVHGIFVRILGGEDASAIRAELFDRQQRGVRVLERGHSITIADATTLDIYYRGTVESVDYRDERYLSLSVTPPLPRAPAEGDVINNLSRNPDVVLANSSIGKNRARGVLLSTSGKILVENNRFHTPGSAIRVSSGVDYWYESGPVNDVVIRNNDFDNCRYGIWSGGVIDIVAVDGKKSQSTTPYHGRVAITGNRFTSFDGLIVKAYRVAELEFTGNRIVHSDAYPPFRTVAAPIETMAVGKLEVANVQVEGFEFASLTREATQKPG